MVPLGVGEELKQHIAEIIKIVEQSGLDYHLGAMQTTIEGEPDAVMDTIMKCHRHMRERAPRVLTTITIDDRAGAENRLWGKVTDVEAVLGREVGRG
jgi:uncharacterized protein (TIGR00106 family)